MENEISRNAGHLGRQFSQMGFGENWEARLVPTLLMVALTNSAYQFAIEITEPLEKQTMRYLLFAERKNKEDLFNVIGYHARKRKLVNKGLTQHNGSANAVDEKQEIERTFWRQGTAVITKQEAKNLFENRPVFKHYIIDKGEEKAQWFKMKPGEYPIIQEPGQDFFNGQQTFPAFDLENAVKKYPLVLREDHDFDYLMTGLKKGDRYELPMIRKGKEEKFFIVANPEQQAVEVFDHGGRKVRLSEFQSRKQQNKNNKNKGRGRSLM